VLLHGLIRSSMSMSRIANRLQSEGYTVYNMNYPAREIPINEIVDELHERLKICCLSGTKKLHFVTHSMGGIVVRSYIAKYHPENIGRVVMMGPPNHGSELADLLKDNVLVGYIFGPAVQELGTTPDSTPNKLGPVDFELGIITGNSSWNPIGSWVIPGPDDGTVSVNGAQLKSMKDFLVMPYTHTFIMLHADVINEIVYFLQHGEFMALDSGE
jgi:triacylglycerol lipase